MHGAICEPYCLACGNVTPAYSPEPICPALAGIVEQVETDSPEADIPYEHLPQCRQCRKGMLRPGVVWFGETPRYLDEIDGILRKTEVLLVIGTSSTVRWAKRSYSSRNLRNVFIGLPCGWLRRSCKKAWRKGSSLQSRTFGWRRRCRLPLSRTS